MAQQLFVAGPLKPLTYSLDSKMLLNISDSPRMESRVQPQGPTWKEKLTKMKAAAALGRSACSHRDRKAASSWQRDGSQATPCSPQAQGGQNIVRVSRHGRRGSPWGAQQHDETRSGLLPTLPCHTTPHGARYGGEEKKTNFQERHEF